jgi:hypothetical protein
MVKNSRGAITPLCAGLCIVLALAGFGIWGLLRAWRFQVESQFRLDHQVAQEALSLKSSIQLAEASNQRMTLIRDTALAGAAALTPGALAAVRAELEVERVFQEGLRIQWEAEQATWIIAHPGAQMRLGSWQRLPEDELGAQPYSWSDADFVLETRSGARAAAARILQTDSSTGDNNDDSVATSLSHSEWHAEWASFH